MILGVYTTTNCHSGLARTVTIVTCEPESIKINSKLKMQNSKLQFKVQNYKSSIILGLFILVSFFVTRLVNLTIIPVFVDEAIYIRWAQVMRAVASLRFLPLSDGKQPFFMWLIIPFLKIFNDPLVAGRLVSIFAGFGTMIGIFVLTYLLFKNKHLSFFSALIYVISPFAFFFDRMALADGLLSLFGIWFLIFAILTVLYQRLDCAMIAGILLGLGLITKSPAIIFAILLPTTILFFDWKKSDSVKWLKLFGLWLVIGIFAFAIYNILRLGPEFHMIAIRNKDYVFSFSEVLNHPFNPLIANLKSVINWNFILLTPLVFLSGIVGIYFALKKNFKSGVILLIWLIAPLFAQSLIAKVFTSRYIFFTVPFILIFAAFTINEVFTKVHSKILTTVFLVIIFLFPVLQLRLLMFSPQSAWLPANERSGYLEMWTAGYGIKESADYLKEVAKTQKVLVGTEGYFGTLPDGLQIYLEKVPNITVIGVGYPIKEIPEKLKNGLFDNRVFLLVNDSRFEVKNTAGLKLISRYPKAVNPKTGSRENLLFLEVVGNN